MSKIKGGSESLVVRATMLGIIGDFEASLMEFQKKYDEMIILVEAGSLDGALEQVDSLLIIVKSMRFTS